MLFWSEMDWLLSVYGPGFLLRILWHSQSGDHPENNLAKFGYIVDMKVRNFFFKKNFYILGYLSGRYPKTLTIWNFLKFEIWQIWVNFPIEKVLCIGWNHLFFQVDIQRIFATKRNTRMGNTGHSWKHCPKLQNVAKFPSRTFFYKKNCNFSIKKDTQFAT